MKDSFENEKVTLGLKGIFHRRFGIHPDQVNADFMDKDLLGHEIGMNPRDLLYLFFDIEKEFGIVIPQEDVAGGRFTNLKNIYEIICEQTDR